MTAKRALVLAVILIPILLSGCPFARETVYEPDFYDEGSLRILLPDTNSEIAEFRISGSTAGGRSFSRIEPAGTSALIQEGLFAGIWTIRVDAFNAAVGLVLTGSAVVLVESGLTSSVEIILTDPAGDGTVSFRLQWPSELLSAPSVVSVLENVDGSAAYDLVFAVDGVNSAAEYSGEWPAGFYTLRVSLYEETSKVWGDAYALHISLGAATSRVAALVLKDLDLPPGTRIWKFSAGSSLTSSIWSSPALSPTGKIYIGSDTGRLYALDAETGAQDWNHLTGDRITSSPSVGADGTIYVGSYDGNLYAINPDTGTVVWSFTTGGWVRSSPAIGDDGTVYFGSNDGYIYAVDPATGGEIWSYNTGAAVTSSPAVDSSGVVYAGSYNGNIYAVQSGGTQLWVYATGGWVHSSPALGADGAVYAGSYDGFLYAIDGAAGTLRWSFDTGDWIGSSPALDDERGRVYIGSRNGNLYAVDVSTGTEIWSYFAGNGGVYSVPAVGGGDGVVYFGSYDLNIYAVNPDGSEQWRFKTGIGGVSSSPVIGPGGTVYVGSRDGNLYALASSSDGPAESSWPMFHRDLRRTGAAK